jgi:hypothetical protein
MLSETDMNVQMGNIQIGHEYTRNCEHCYEQPATERFTRISSILPESVTGQWCYNPDWKYWVCRTYSCLQCKDYVQTNMVQGDKNFPFMHESTPEGYKGYCK